MDGVEDLRPGVTECGNPSPPTVAFTTLSKDFYREVFISCYYFRVVVRAKYRVRVTVVFRPVCVHPRSYYQYTEYLTKDPSITL